MTDRQPQLSDDASLIKTICEGEGKAQSEAMYALDTIHRAALRRHLLLRWRALGDRVDDVVQEVFLKVWRNACSFRGVSSVRAWMYRIAWNHLVDENRRPEIELQHLAEEEDLDGFAMPDCSTEDEHAMLDRVEETLRELARQAPERAEALRLMYVEGYSGAELAEVLQRPLRGTFEYLNQCRGKFRKIFAELSADRSLGRTEKS